MYKLVSIIGLLFIFNLSFSQTVVINEIVSLNNNIILDDFGEESDWIELYNNLEISVDIGSWSLSDEESNLLKWIFPDTIIGPNGFVLIFCSGRDTLSGFFHSNFKLKSSGESIFLTDASGTLADFIIPTALENDVSFGRKTDGGPDFGYFYKTSPGFTNSSNLLLNKVSFSSPEGFYSTNIELSIYSDDTVGQIFYTTNGNEPTPGTSYTFVYNGPLTLSELQALPAVYSYISTTPDTNIGYFNWQEPEGEIEKCAVLKARVFENEQPLCNTVSGTFFLANKIHQRFSFPVLSLIMDSIDLFSEDTGIYVPGKRYIPGILKSGNYFETGDAWERKGSFAYFSPNGELLYKQNLGIEIQGNITRAAPNKSLEFTVKECYDGNDHFDFPFFEAYPLTDYKKVITRSLYAAHNRSIVRDEIMQEIAKNLNVFYQEWQPLIAFLNGEYWGFQVMREKPDEHYLHQHFGIDTDSVDIISVWGVTEAGDEEEHLNLISFVENHDLSLPENYEIIKEMIDIQAYIDYYVTEIFIANRDWPGNNYTKWRQKGINNQWRWFLFDLDNGGMILDLNNIKRATGDTIDEIMPEWSTCMFKSILSNEEFKADFIARFVEVLNNDFHADNTIPVVDKWEAIVGGEAENLKRRWHVINSVESWHEEMEQLRQFFIQRPCIVKGQLEEYFEIDSLNINCGPSFVPIIPDERIKVFPVPSNHTIYIKSVESITSWELFTLSGILVEKKIKCDSLNEEIDISNLGAAIYFLRLTIKNSLYQYKVIKTN